MASEVVVNADALAALLLAMDEWLGNEEGLMIEDVIAWREQLAVAIGQPSRE